MILSIIVAMDEQGTIGRDNQLPWHLSADLRQLKATTMGKPIIMGRRTYESIGRPLPGRDNIVITRNPAYTAPGCRVFNDVEAALSHCQSEPEAVVMGGEEIFRQLLDRTDRIYLTLVHTTVPGDTFFPALQMSEWREVSRERHGADADNDFDYSFVRLERPG